MRSLIVLMVSSALLSACHAQQTTDSSHRASPAGGSVEVKNAPTSINRPSDSAQGAYLLVEKLLSDPRIVTRSWKEMRRAFPDGCQQVAGDTEIICPPIAGVTRISAIASGHGIVELTMTSPVTCDGVRAVVVNRFGPSTKNSINGCSADWSLGEYMKTGYLRLSKGKKDPGKVSLQFGVEQGP